MGLYEEVPFLAILNRRKDLLPENPAKVEGTVFEAAVKHLRDVLFSRAEPKPVPPRVFFVEANLVAFSPSPRLWERFARYYADLSTDAFKRGERALDEHYPPRGSVKVPDFLAIRRPYDELKLYHLEVRGGVVYLGDREPLFRASLLYNDILRWLEEKVRRVVLSGALDGLRDVATKAITPPGSRKRGYPFISRLLSAVGIPDGRKRILFYWLIPYWVTVEGRTPSEALELANEWLSRQGGGKIYSSWILSEAENVRSKGIKPWSIQKVERIDPELIKLLRGMKLL